MDEDDLGPWQDMAGLQHLVELDLVTMKFANVKALLTAVGPRLETLTLEMDEDQVGSWWFFSKNSNYNSSWSAKSTLRKRMI